MKNYEKAFGTNDQKELNEYLTSTDKLSKGGILCRILKCSVCPFHNNCDANDTTLESLAEWGEKEAE